MNELNKQINQAKAYVRAMKRKTKADNGDCDNLIIHLDNIEMLTNHLPVQNVVFPVKSICNCCNSEVSNGSLVCMKCAMNELNN